MERIQASALTRPEVFAFSGFYPAKQRGENTKDFPRYKLHGVSLNKNERQALINSVVTYTYTHVLHWNCKLHIELCSPVVKLKTKRDATESINNSVTTNIRLINKPQFRR